MITWLSKSKTGIQPRQTGLGSEVMLAKRTWRSEGSVGILVEMSGRQLMGWVLSSKQERFGDSSLYMCGESYGYKTVVLEKTPETPLDCKEIKPVNCKGNQSWIFIGRTDAEAETPILWPSDAKNWKRPWCWERLKVGGEGDDRGWDGWMASSTRWTWIWVSSGSWWWTGKPGVLQSMGLQRVRHNWATELN